MSAGFGFSVGDFLAALQLVGTVIDALRESSHSSSSFRSLINELYALESVLLRVKRLDLDDRHDNEKFALRNAASLCQDTISAFWTKIQKYQPHLQKSGTDSRIKDGWAKIKWAVCKKDDLETFRAQIQGHTSSIEILLLVVQMEATTVDVRKQDSQHKSLASQIQGVSCQVMAKLSVIADRVGQSVQQGKILLETSAQIVQINLRVFQIVHDIQLFILRIPGQIQRQQPVYLTDVWNRETPFHLEFVRSADALLAVLKINMQESGCDPDMISRGEYVIEESGTQDLIDITKSWEKCFYPGQRVAMSMIFKQPKTATSSCPRCGKDHDESTGKETTCIACGAIYRRIEEIVDEKKETSQGPTGDESDVIDMHRGLTNGPPRPPKRKRADNTRTSPRKFRRIRIITTSEPLHEWHIRQPAYECVFWFLSCSYISHDRQEWETHCLSHFEGEEPPKLVQCPLCDFYGAYDKGWTTWTVIMDHVACCHHMRGESLRTGRSDLHLINHLWQKRLIDDPELIELKIHKQLTSPPSRPIRLGTIRRRPRAHDARKSHEST